MARWGMISAMVLLTAAIGGAGWSQVIEKPTLTLEGAKKVAAAAVTEAMRDKAGGVLAIVDDGGNLMYVERLDNTFAAGANIAIGKARTAALFKRPSKFFEEIIKNGRTAMVALPDFTPLQGGVPIEVDGRIVGAIGVSGAASAARDEEVAMAGARALHSAASASATPAGAAIPAAISYFDKAQVASAFAKGAVLVDGSGNRNYMVHTSRRTGPGMAEVHMKDTDIIYVIDGSATFVTGGTVLDGKSTAPDEIRGASIANGERRRIAKGDVIVVPNGTPHWFQEVQGPLNYYVVKVR